MLIGNEICENLNYGDSMVTFSEAKAKKKLILFTFLYSTFFNNK